MEISDLGQILIALGFILSLLLGGKKKRRGGRGGLAEFARRMTDPDPAAEFAKRTAEPDSSVPPDVPASPGRDVESLERMFFSEPQHLPLADTTHQEPHTPVDPLHATRLKGDPALESTSKEAGKIEFFPQDLPDPWDDGPTHTVHIDSGQDTHGPTELPRTGTLLPANLRQAVIWHEILGPPKGMQ